MKRLMKSWLFFASLLALLLAAAFVLPEMGEQLLGSTEQRLTRAVGQISRGVEAVWGEK